VDDEVRRLWNLLELLAWVAALFVIVATLAEEVLHIQVLGTAPGKSKQRKRW
jgi:hypothetical protein